MRKSTAIIFILLTTISVSAQTKPVQPKAATTATAEAKTPADRLPVKRVVLYKNGIGYFEHTGQVHGTQELSIDFTSGQLNDVVKSLTVLDLGQNGGKISGVRYNPTAPLAERLKGLRLPIGEQTPLAGFLAALRGARVEVRNGATTAIGRLLSVDERQVTKGDAILTTITQASVITDTGDVRLFEVTPSTSIRIVEHDLNMEVGKYLGLVSSTRERDVRRMTISAEGTGDRPLFVSYISEVPIWKSTYRIVLPTDPKAKPLLQGWAIVDNTVGEDWKDVQLSLVSGAPQSFIQQLSQPYYARRPSANMPQAFQLTPQTHEETIEAQNAPGPPPPPSGADRMNTPGAGLTDYEAMGSASKTEGLQNFSKLNRPSGGPLGRGVGAGVGGGAFRVGGGVAPSPNAYTDAITAIPAEAEGKELGDLFEYKLKQRVTIGKNQSALVPIVHANIEADKVSLWNDSRTHALRALWINNTSGLSLDGGTFNIFEDNTFAGEGVLDVIKPGEKRLLSYAVDQAIHIDSDSDTESERVTRVKIVHGVMTQISGQREKRTYKIRNADASARTVVIEHPERNGWKITSDTKPVESTSSFHRFCVNAEPNKTAELIVEEVQPLENRFSLSNINDDQIALFLKQKTISPELEKTLRGIVAQRAETSTFELHIQDRRRETAEISQDQQRLRENMKALKGTAEEKALTQRYATQLNQQEDRLAALRKEIADLEVQRNSSQSKLTKMIEDISLDVTM